LNVVEGKVVGVTPIEEATVNSTSLCVKGRYHSDMLNSDQRITTPLIKKDGIFVEATYDEAFDFIAKKVTEIKEKYGPESLAGLSSARCVNEDNYIFQKLFRVGFGNNNIDHCART
jgi:formate dehydrogenase alpha subunit